MVLILQFRPQMVSMLPSFKSGVWGPSSRCATWTQNRRGSNNPLENMGSSTLRVFAPRALEGEAMEVKQLVVGQEKSGSTLISCFNEKINNWSKWAVVSLVAVTLLWRHDEQSLWAVVGAVANGSLCKFLKRFINEDRPATANGLKEDPGMPSSHAQGFSYLATYAALVVLFWQGLTFWTMLIALGILLSMIYMSWLRVVEGLHTIPQVLVGGTLGSAMGVFWLWLWRARVGSALDSSQSMRILLYLTFLASCIVSYRIALKSWQLGEP